MEVIYPMFTLAMFTIAMVVALGIARFIIVSRQQVDPSYLETFDGDQQPPKYALALARNYSNLLEMPVLFYIVGLLFVILNITNENFIIYAWAYVICRFIHTFVHVVYNNPLHRLIVFIISSAFLVIMWVIVLQNVMSLGH